MRRVGPHSFTEIYFAGCNPSFVETTDGYVMIAAGSDALFARLAAALGTPELARDPRFVDNPSRVTNRGASTSGSGVPREVSCIRREWQGCPAHP